MPWVSGDVIKVWDHLTHPPKFKRHVCVCPEKQLFFRINSEAIFPPHLPLMSDASDFLEHDSYLELQQLIRLQAFHIENAEKIGAISNTQKLAVVIAIENGGWLSENIVDFIKERFGLSGAE